MIISLQTRKISLLLADQDIMGLLAGLIFY